MKKNIRDYLHLYPMVNIHICEPGCEPVPAHLEGYDWATNMALAERTSYNPEWIVPLLRKLNDMKRSELIEWAEMIGTEINEEDLDDILLQIRADGLDGLEISDNSPSFVFKLTHFLLSKHFDIFGLIEDRLAKPISYANKNDERRAD